jgi:carbon storage regulator CsrA
MLILSRKVGQKLVIDDNITIVINRIAGNRVSIGIEAPKDVHILRGELDKIRREFDDSEAEPEQRTPPLSFVAEFEVDTNLPVN